jgi:hypothetical protein
VILVDKTGETSAYLPPEGALAPYAMFASGGVVVKTGERVSNISKIPISAGVGVGLGVGIWVLRSLNQESRLERKR